MSDSIPDIGVTLAADPTPSIRRRRAAIGQGVRLTARFTDRVTGAPVAVTDPSITVQPPATNSGALPAPLVFVADQLTPAGAGAWRLDVLGDKAGTWRVRAECTTPRAAAVEIEFDVTASNVVPPPASAPMLVTDDLGPIVTAEGGVLTAQRITALPEATSVDGLQLVGAQGDASRTIPWETLRDAFLQLGPSQLDHSTNRNSGLIFLL